MKHILYICICWLY